MQLKIALLLKGGNFPTAYPYPAEWRATRDLLRRRICTWSTGAANWSPISRTPIRSTICRHLIKNSHANTTMPEWPNSLKIRKSALIRGYLLHMRFVKKSAASGNGCRDGAEVSRSHSRQGLYHSRRCGGWKQAREEPWKPYPVEGPNLKRGMSFHMSSASR